MAEEKSIRQQYFNAFSNGVVPKGIDQSWMIGRKNEFAALVSMLQQAKEDQISNFKLLEGKYGSGKSMMLSVFETEAIEQGFIVSRFSLGTHNNFSKPEIIYRDLMNHLKVKSGNNLQEFEEIFEDWLHETKNISTSNEASKKIFEVIKELHKYHPSFANVLLVFIRGKINNDIELSNIAAGWIKGDYNIPYEQKKKLNIKGSIDRHNAFDILRGFSKLVSLLGFKGIVILVDELEYIVRERVDIRNKAYTTMRHLIDEIGENKWENTIFVGAHTPELMEDEEKGYKSYEALYQRITSGFDDTGLISDYSNFTIIPLDLLTEDELITIGIKVIELKDISIDSKHLSRLALIEFKKRENSNGKSVVIREYLKIVIHMMELAEANPNMPIFRVNSKRNA